MATTLSDPNLKAAKLDTSDPLVTVAVAAMFLCMPRSTVYQLLDRGVIPSVNLAGVGTKRIRRIRTSALQNYIAAGSN